MVKIEKNIWKPHSRNYNLSVIIMASSLSNLVYNLAKRIHIIKCKYDHDNEKCKMYGITY